MRSPQAVANTRRFFAHSNARHAQAHDQSMRSRYTADCYLLDKAHPDATYAERDQAHRTVAKQFGV